MQCLVVASAGVWRQRRPVGLLDLLHKCVQQRAGVSTLPGSVLRPTSYGALVSSIWLSVEMRPVRCECGVRVLLH